jgi:hypothetical protein
MKYYSIGYVFIVSVVFDKKFALIGRYCLWPWTFGACEDKFCDL